MKRIQLLTLLVFVLSISWAGYPSRAASSEAFPLRKGLLVLYSYQWQNQSIDIMVGGTLATDSGTVAYHVIDSTATSDTSQVWTVVETKHLLHRHYSVTLYNPPSLDSSYWVDSSQNFSLLEELTGLHRLHSGSLVWSFPVRDTLRNIGYGRRDTTVDVFRFGAPGSQIIVDLWNGNSWINDTLGLKAGQGLATREFAKGDASNVRDNYELNVSLLSTTAGVGPSLGGLPSTSELYQNYPNPFNPSTIIRYTLPARTHVHLTVLNMLGQRVATLVDEFQDAGFHDVRFEGSGLASGVYFYRLQAVGFVQSRKMVLLK